MDTGILALLHIFCLYRVHLINLIEYIFSASHKSVPDQVPSCLAD